MTSHRSMPKHGYTERCMHAPPKCMQVLWVKHTQDQDSSVHTNCLFAHWANAECDGGMVQAIYNGDTDSIH